MTIQRPTRLRLERWSKGLTLLDLQFETGVPATRLSLAERRLARLTWAERVAIAQALDVMEPDLFEDDSGETP